MNSAMHTKVGDFVRRLYQVTTDLEKIDGNHVMGPMSIYTCLAMVSMGAEGETLKELLSGLSLADVQEVTGGVATLFNDILKSQGSAELVSVSRIYSIVDLKKEFTEKCMKHFNALAETANFKEESDKWANVINKFVNDATHGKINKIVEASLLKDASTILINAMYFRGVWETPFRASLFDLNFHRADKSVVEIPFMVDDINVNYAEFPHLKLKAIKKNLTASPFQVMIILPDEKDGFGEMTKTLFTDKNAKENFEHVFFNTDVYEYQKISLYIPKFRISSEMDNLVDNFKRLGVKKIFSRESELIQLTGQPEYISDIIHKATFEFNEDGVEASAASVVMTMLLCAKMERPPCFRADHTFLTAITSKEGLPLFIGHVDYPKYD